MQKKNVNLLISKKADCVQVDTNFCPQKFEWWPFRLYNYLFIPCRNDPGCGLTLLHQPGVTHVVYSFRFVMWYSPTNLYILNISVLLLSCILLREELKSVSESVAVSKLYIIHT